MFVDRLGDLAGLVTILSTEAGHDVIKTKGQSGTTLVRQDQLLNWAAIPLSNRHCKPNMVITLLAETML